MEQIITNLSDPSWWFTGVFFVGIGILVKNLPIGWLTSLSKKRNRYLKKKELQKIKNHRHHEIKIHFMMGGYWFSATIQTGLMVTAIIIYSANPSISDGFQTLVLPVGLYLFSILFSFLVSTEKRILEKTIEEHIKLKKMHNKTLNTDSLKLAG